MEAVQNFFLKKFDNISFEEYHEKRITLSKKIFTLQSLFCKINHLKMPLYSETIKDYRFELMMRKLNDKEMPNSFKNRVY